MKYLLIIQMVLLLSHCRRDNWVVTECPAGTLEYLPQQLQDLHENFTYVNASGEEIEMEVDNIYTSKAYRDSCHEHYEPLGFDVNRMCEPADCPSSAEIRTSNGKTGDAELTIYYRTNYRVWQEKGHSIFLNIDFNDDRFRAYTDKLRPFEKTDSIFTNLKLGEHTYDRVLYMVNPESYVNKKPTARFIYYSAEQGVVGFELWDTNEFFYLK